MGTRVRFPVWALLAHEMSHLAHDTKQLLLLQGLSTLLMMPVYYLALLHDFTGNEQRADAFAARTMGETASLIAALAVTMTGQNVYRSSRGDQLPSWLHQRILNRTVHWLALIANDDIFAAAYPSFAEREAWIKTLESNPATGSNSHVHT